MTTGGTPFSAAPVVVLLGPPGAGKRTQARRLEEAFGFVRLPARATADVAPTAQGENVLAALATGLSANGPARGVVIEGFPGTAAEAEALDRLLSLSGRAVVAAVAFDVDDVKVIHRVAGRYSCADCGAGYHDDFRPTATSGVCDACGGARMIRRADDRPAAAMARLDAYHAGTAPLVEYYDRRQVLKRIDATGPIDRIGRTIAENVRAA